MVPASSYELFVSLQEMNECHTCWSQVLASQRSHHMSSAQENQKGLKSTSLGVLAQRPKAANERGTFGVRHRQLTLSRASCQIKFVPNYWHNIPGLWECGNHSPYTPTWVLWAVAHFSSVPVPTPVTSNFLP